MSWIEILDNDIYYVEAGDGPPMVFLHGMSSCAEAWWQQFEHFAQNYRVFFAHRFMSFLQVHASGKTVACPGEYHGTDFFLLMKIFERLS